MLRKFILLMLLPDLVWSEAQGTIQAAKGTPSPRRPEFVKLLLKALDESDEPNDNHTGPYLRELSLSVLDNSQNIVEIKFGPNLEGFVGKSVLDLVADTLEKALLDAEQLGFPTRFCTEAEYCP